ncbi:MAG: PAS domain S-box protein, partial [Nostocaceae cyanobacterium]|nr:PAS domain S-box protein [Nostocaceae cyanobacterium]
MNQSDKSEPANNVEIANSVGVDSKGVHNLQLYAEIVNNMQVGICVWQWVNPLDITAFKLIASNPFAEQLTNRSLRTLIGQRIQDCFPNISRENLELFVRVIRSKQSESQPELDYSDEFAPESFYSYKAFPLPEQCVGVALENITECQLSQIVLQESEERFRATFEQAAVGIAHVDLDGRWLRVNQKLCDILGYTREELLMQKFQDITYPDDLESDLQSIRQLLTLEIQTYSMEKRYIHRDGSPIWVYLTVSLVSSESQPKYFLSVIEEIGDRKQAELVLQERANELTRLNTILAQTTTLLNKRKQEMDQFAYVASHDLKAPLR